MERREVNSFLIRRSCASENGAQISNVDHITHCLMLKYYRVLKRDPLVMVSFSLPYSAASVEFTDLVTISGHRVGFNTGSGCVKSWDIEPSTAIG